MEIIARKYRRSDYPELIDLLGKVYESKIDQDTLEIKYISENRTIIVAENIEGQLLGCAFIEIQEDFVRPSKILYTTYVAVNEIYRNQGIGKRLFEEIEHICSEQGCHAIELTSADYRLGAHAFYHAIGFTKKKTTLFIKENQKVKREESSN